jgi:hypothetical protein
MLSVPEALSLGVMWPAREGDHSPTSAAEVNECVELYLYSPNTPSWCGPPLKKKHRDNFAFTFTVIADKCLLLQIQARYCRYHTAYSRIFSFISYIFTIPKNETRDSSVSTVYGLDDPITGVRFPA